MKASPTLIKVCGLTRLDDGAMCLEAGVDYLGLIFASSPRRAPEGLGRLFAQLGASTVGVFRGRSDDDIVRIVEDEEIRIVQLHDPSSPALRDHLERGGVEVWRAVHAADWRTADLQGARRLLLDGPAPGSGQLADWSGFVPDEVDRPFLIAGGLTPDNVAAMIDLLHPHGVDVASGVESSPGVKSPELVARFVTQVRHHPEEGIE